MAWFKKEASQEYVDAKDLLDGLNELATIIRDLNAEKLEIIKSIKNTKTDEELSELFKVTDDFSRKLDGRGHDVVWGLANFYRNALYDDVSKALSEQHKKVR